MYYKRLVKLDLDIVLYIVVHSDWNRLDPPQTQGLWLSLKNCKPLMAERFECLNTLAVRSRMVSIITYFGEQTHTTRFKEVLH